MRDLVWGQREIWTLSIGISQPKKQRTKEFKLFAYGSKLEPQNSESRSIIRSHMTFLKFYQALCKGMSVCLPEVSESERIQPGSRNLPSLAILKGENLIRGLVTLITKVLRSKTGEATQGLGTESCYHPFTERRQGGDDVPRTISEAVWQELEQWRGNCGAWNMEEMQLVMKHEDRERERNVLSSLHPPPFNLL